MNSEGSSLFEDLPDSGSPSQSLNSARRLVRELAEYSRKVTQSISREIKSKSRSIAAGQLSQTSRKLDTLAEALREAADKLREDHSYSLATIMEAGSENVMRLGNNLRGTSPEMIIGEVEDFARNQPMIFFGSAVVAGILLRQLFASPGEGDGAVQEVHPKKESSIEYKPGHDEGEYYAPH